MLDYYVEYCRTKHDRRGRFLPFREAVKLFDTEAAGYCSLYLFRKEDILPFRAAQSSKGLAQVPVYAERLWIDIDREDNIPLARAETDIVRRHLESLGLAFSVWESGGKGYVDVFVAAPVFACLKQLFDHIAKVDRFKFCLGQLRIHTAGVGNIADKAVHALDVGFCDVH